MNTSCVPQLNCVTGLLCLSCTFNRFEIDLHLHSQRVNPLAGIRGNRVEATLEHPQLVPSRAVPSRYCSKDPRHRGKQVAIVIARHQSKRMSA